MDLYNRPPKIKTLGRVVLDEVPCEITAIRLEAGEIIIYAEAYGTHTVNEGAALSIHGPDGKMVFSRGPTSTDSPQSSKNGVIYVRLPIRLLP